MEVVGHWEEGIEQYGKVAQLSSVGYSSLKRGSAVRKGGSPVFSGVVKSERDSRMGKAVNGRGRAVLGRSIAEKSCTEWWYNIRKGR